MVDQPVPFPHNSNSIHKNPTAAAATTTTTQPAVYLLDGTEENIQRVADDCSNRLYSQVYLNFVSRLDRPLMEKLARATIASNTYSLVTKVFDQYLDFVTLEPRLFTLNQAVRNT